MACPLIKVKGQVYNLISNLKTYRLTPGHWSCSFVCHSSSTGSIQSCSRFGALNVYRTHCHLCPIRNLFSPDSSEAFEGEVPCPRTQHLNNVPRFRGDKHDISLKILHQAGFETARQAATSAKCHDLTIPPCYTVTPYYPDGDVEKGRINVFLNSHFQWLFQISVFETKLARVA